MADTFPVLQAKIKLEADGRKRLLDLLDKLVAPINESTTNALKPMRLDNPDSSKIIIWLEDPSTFGYELGEFAQVRDIDVFKAEKEDPNKAAFLFLKDRFGTNWKKVSPPESSFRFDLSGRLQETKTFNSPGKWDHLHVKATDLNVLITYFSIGPDRLLFRSEAAKTKFKYLFLRFIQQTKKAELQAQFKIDGVVPALPEEFVEHPKYPLSSYQKAALGFSISTEGAALFMEPGTGKTAITIARICLEAAIRRAKIESGEIVIPENKSNVYTALIVCPNQVRQNWASEIQKFATCSGRVTVIRGAAIKRRRLFGEGLRKKEGEKTNQQSDYYRIVIIGYDSFVADIDFYQLVEWDLMACDESHYFKSGETQRWKKGILPFRDNVKSRMALTGTPVANSLNDLYTQLEYLGEGQSGFSTFNAFKHFFGQYERRAVTANYTIEEFVKERNVPMLQERLARLSFSITKKEAGLQLPDKVYSLWEVQMTKRQREIYIQVANTLSLEIENMSGENFRMDANNILTKLLRLAQITCGFVTWDALTNELTGEEIRPKIIEQIEQDLDNPKVKAVLQILEEDKQSSPDSKTIIWATFREDLKLLERTIRAAGYTCASYYGDTSEAAREEAVRRFNNDPDFKVLICNAKTAGEGLNLLGYNPNNDEEQASYCGKVIFFSQNWSMIERQQAEDRAHRRGTKMPVGIVDLCVLGTIDEEIRVRVMEKRKTAELVNDLSVILKNVLNTNELDND